MRHLLLLLVLTACQQSVSLDTLDRPVVAVTFDPGFALLDVYVFPESALDAGHRSECVALDDHAIVDVNGRTIPLLGAGTWDAVNATCVSSWYRLDPAEPEPADEPARVTIADGTGELVVEIPNLRSPRTIDLHDDELEPGGTATLTWQPTTDVLGPPEAWLVDQNSTESTRVAVTLDTRTNELTFVVPEELSWSVTTLVVSAEVEMPITECSASRCFSRQRMVAETPVRVRADW